MKLDDYEKADCTLFRLPPIDTSKIEELLTAQLVQAWQQGQNATQALQAVLNNEQAINAVVDELQTHLSFQQATATSNLESQVTQNTQAYEQEKAQQIAQISSTLIEEKTAKEQQHQRTLQEAQAKNKIYTAEQQRLDEMRARVEARLEKFGGRKNLDALMQIHTAVQTNTTLHSPKGGGKKTYPSSISAPDQNQSNLPPNQMYASTSPSSYAAKNEFSNTIARTAEGKYNLPSLDPKTNRQNHQGQQAQSLDTVMDTAVKEEKTEPQIIAQVSSDSNPGSSQIEKTEKPYRFLKKVWQVLNYKIW